MAGSVGTQAPRTSSAPPTTTPYRLMTVAVTRMFVRAMAAERERSPERRLTSLEATSATMGSPTTRHTAMAATQPTP